MISTTALQEVKRMLAEGIYSHREISRMTGVSRGSIHNIASGRPKKSDRPRVHEFKHETEKYARCPDCGATVLMPCLKCHILKNSQRTGVGSRNASEPHNHRP